MSAGGEIIEFGRFRLHRRNRTLLADGLKLDLGARAIEVLLALIDAGGTMVTKDALLDRVWSGVIVEEITCTRRFSRCAVPSVPIVA
jgi:DNA-binding winged helix-turn-helix (wHTH) protein